MRVLDVLESLDRHDFDVVEVESSIDTLYKKVFCTSQIEKEATYNEVSSYESIKI